VKTNLTTILSALTRQRGVTGSLLVDEADGVIIDATLHVGVKGSAFAALAASLYRKARLSAIAARLGAVGFMQLEAEKGRLCAVGRNGLVLIAIARRDANVGLIRVELLRAAEGLA
jgi:predicted regulator of Ras-like GTPase activity (Roadblock/LC7/MglB family)